MNRVQIDDAELVYRDHGEGPPLLLIHAFPVSGAMWQPQIAALAERRRVIAPDLRGFGASSLGATPQTLDRYADDLALLLDHLKIERATVAGLSMGGYIAFAMLRHHRERIAGLILADTRPQADTPEGRQGRETNARIAESEGAGAIADKMLPNLLSRHAPDAIVDQVRVLIEANRPEGIAAALRCMALRPDSTDLLPTIDVPALVIVGSEDSLTPPDVARAMHEAIPNSQLVAIPGVGHLANLEAPDAFNAALLEGKQAKER